MPYHVNSSDSTDAKYSVRFRGTAMIPRINQMAPCRMQLTMRAIEDILESMHRRPIRIEMKYVDRGGREWELKYGNFKQIILSDQKADEEEVLEPVGQTNLNELPDLGQGGDPAGNVPQTPVQAPTQFPAQPPAPENIEPPKTESDDVPPEQDDLGGEPKQENTENPLEDPEGSDGEGDSKSEGDIGDSEDTEPKTDGVVTDAQPPNSINPHPSQPQHNNRNNKHGNRRH